jgi:hypothetical protein
MIETNAPNTVADPLSESVRRLRGSMLAVTRCGRMTD